MTETSFRIAIIAAASAFLGVFALVVNPPFIANPDIIGAFAAGFTNPMPAAAQPTRSPAGRSSPHGSSTNATPTLFATAARV
jgi:hypothetical protein